MPNPERVSIHGCHSREFCGHADDTLADILQEYADQEYRWVGVTEHMPVDTMAYMPSEEAEAGLTVATLNERFDRYAQSARGLKSELAGRLDVIFGFETEVYPGYKNQLDRLLDVHQPEYIVGSVHFLNGLGIDSSPEKLQKNAAQVGGFDVLYNQYFDTQLELIERYSPRVIGHFDLIRLFDANYERHMDVPDVWERIERNLHVIKERDAILDFNIAAIRKGLSEPYPCERITRLALEMGIPLVPGEDAHNTESVGMNRDRAVEGLVSLGGSTDWRRPV